ncbi:MAG: putative hydrolase of the alpha/beta superfamily [Gemmatimonadetes bacterium]|nr:putative hydrolase of the alpha/beta superfamily [Gemmatimonadota bacterium]
MNGAVPCRPDWGAKAPGRPYPRTPGVVLNEKASEMHEETAARRSEAETEQGVQSAESMQSAERSVATEAAENADATAEERTSTDGSAETGGDRLATVTGEPPVVPEWKDYPEKDDGQQHTVVGTVRVMRGLHSPELGNARDVLVYLPPSYATDADRRYPVLYMHDGQNLFDRATSFSGEWEVDKTLEDASAEGLETIVVGIANAGPERLDEYSPFVDAEHGGGRGDAYLDFVVHTLKPIIDRNFRTLPERGSTGIAGSSMGGLITLYAFFRNAETFGFAGVMSPALWFADRAIYAYVQAAPFVPGRIYVDVGTREGREELADVRRLRDILIAKGYRKGRDFLYVVEMGGTHSEAAWARRLRKELQFLLDLPTPAAKA